MKHIINGGIYRVVFNGANNSEFKGEHPALCIKTLKENEIFIIVPLTTYKEDRWGKIKKKGYGRRILSTDSIARIDKFQIIHKDNIKNRWKDKNGDCLRILPNELEDVSKKIDKYIALSTQKALSDYSKFYYQYEIFVTNINEILCNARGNDNYINTKKIGSENIIEIENKFISQLSKVDIAEVFKDKFDTAKSRLVFSEKYMKIIY